MDSDPASISILAAVVYQRVQDPILWRPILERIPSSPLSHRLARRARHFDAIREELADLAKELITREAELEDLEDMVSLIYDFLRVSGEVALIGRQLGSDLETEEEGDDSETDEEDSETDEEETEEEEEDLFIGLSGHDETEREDTEEDEDSGVEKRSR